MYSLYSYTNRKVYKERFHTILQDKMRTKFSNIQFVGANQMKQKLSITIEKETIKLLDNVIKDGVFRNKSHAIEFSLNKILKEKEND